MNDTERETIESAMALLGFENIQGFYETAAKKADAAVTKKQKDGMSKAEIEKLRAACLQHEVIEQLRPFTRQLVRSKFTSREYWMDNFFKALTNVAVIGGSVALAGAITRRLTPVDITIENTAEGTPFDQAQPDFSASTRPSGRRNKVEAVI